MDCFTFAACVGVCVTLVISRTERKTEMEAMIVLCMLAQASDGDAMVLIVIGVPALLILWLLMGWAKTSDEEFLRRISDEEKGED